MSYSRALVVDDLASSRLWLAQALVLAFPGIVVDQAACLAEAAAIPPPPLALIDLGLPDGSGTELVERLCTQAGTLCIIATVFDDDAHLFPALRAGAQGYVLKDQDVNALAAMLQGIAAGQPPLSPSIARRLLRHFQPPVQSAEEPYLTPRETEVLRLTAKGMTLPEVAALLDISRHTVAGYLKEIYRKLRIGTRAEATLEAARRGLIDPSM
jgi:DNA-binding NarL/FixJ family response regulator